MCGAGVGMAVVRNAFPTPLSPYEKRFIERRVTKCFAKSKQITHHVISRKTVHTVESGNGDWCFRIISKRWPPNARGLWYWTWLQEERIRDAFIHYFHNIRVQCTALEVKFGHGRSFQQYAGSFLIAWGPRFLSLPILACPFAPHFVICQHTLCHPFLSN